jgi:hypothetical protein
MNRNDEIVMSLIYLLVNKDCRIINHRTDTWLVAELKVLKGLVFSVFTHRDRTTTTLYEGKDLLEAMGFLKKE